ncbi:hypothetical protein CI109_104996 [Kwoniella shandongensis]|uniref:Uncharacterized protein n=1 Tax=Kwoniella shandongensis TaxID=1734106 RepID=A0A5M6BQG7_9TREE|nr:uncharacterized protein CI109_006711 [Kwoniella shandongensis]KAA5524987.1 hypothetical protein CI109_006711 [Kwoniella shandongensis]
MNYILPPLLPPIGTLDPWAIRPPNDCHDSTTTSLQYPTSLFDGYEMIVPYPSTAGAGFELGIVSSERSSLSHPLLNFIDDNTATPHFVNATQSDDNRLPQVYGTPSRDTRLSDVRPPVFHPYRRDELSAFARSRTISYPPTTCRGHDAFGSPINYSGPSAFSRGSESNNIPCSLPYQDHPYLLPPAEIITNPTQHIAYSATTAISPRHLSTYPSPPLASSLHTSTSRSDPNCSECDASHTQNELDESQASILENYDSDTDSESDSDSDDKPIQNQSINASSNVALPLSSSSSFATTFDSQSELLDATDHSNHDEPGPTARPTESGRSEKGKGHRQCQKKTNNRRRRTQRRPQLQQKLKRSIKKGNKGMVKDKKKKGNRMGIRKGSKSPVSLPTGDFLFAAIKMLTDPQYAKWVSWDPVSRIATIHDTVKFAKDVYYPNATSNKWESFQRNMTNYQPWGFQRLVVPGTKKRSQTVYVPTWDHIESEWKRQGYPMIILTGGKKEFGIGPDDELSGKVTKVADVGDKVGKSQGLDVCVDALHDDDDEMDGWGYESEEGQNDDFPTNHDTSSDEECLVDVEPMKKGSNIILPQEETEHLGLGIDGNRIDILPLKVDVSEEVKRRGMSIWTPGSDNSDDLLNCPSRVFSPSPSIPPTPGPTPGLKSFPSDPLPITPTSAASVRDFRVTRSLGLIEI